MSDKWGETALNILSANSKVVKVSNNSPSKIQMHSDFFIMSIYSFKNKTNNVALIVQPTVQLKYSHSQLYAFTGILEYIDLSAINVLSVNPFFVSTYNSRKC